MEILNIGPLELIVILVLMFVILGPKDMVKTAQRIGGWVRSVTRSPMWREVWGISQDIRELPKKLMDDTGLEEALTDVKKTTQEVANELNEQINEAKEAARVPEVEHLRVETNPLAGPPPGVVPAALPSTTSSSTTPETAQPAALQTAEQAAGDAQPAPEGQAQPVEGAVQESAATVLAAEAAAVAEQPIPAKKTRRKKQAAVEETPSEPLEPAFPPSWVMELPPLEFQPAGTMLPSNGHAAKAVAVDTPGADGAAPAPRPRKRKTAKTAENPPVDGAGSEPSGDNNEAKPARARKPRQPRASKAAENEPVAGSDGNEPPGDNGQVKPAKARKPRQPKAAKAAENAPVDATAANEPSSDNGQEKLARPRKPRQPRAKSTAAEQPAPAGEAIDANDANASVEAASSNNDEALAQTAAPVETAILKETATSMGDVSEEDATSEEGEKRPENLSVEISGQKLLPNPDVQPDSNAA